MFQLGLYLSARQELRAIKAPGFRFRPILNVQSRSRRAEQQQNDGNRWHATDDRRPGGLTTAAPMSNALQCSDEQGINHANQGRGVVRISENWEKDRKHSHACDQKKKSCFAG